MIQNNNFSVLPWYLNIEEQNHRKSYAFGNIYPLFSENGFLLPFQIMRSTRINPITNVSLYYKNGTLFGDITTKVIEAGLQIVRFETLGYDVVVFPANMLMQLNTQPGMYYLSLSDGVQTWYSDIITVINDISGYLKISWYDLENFVFDAGQIVYQNPAFKNFVYFANELGKPEYTFDEVGDNRDGYFFPEKQVSEKTYKTTVLAPEYLCDVLRFVRMSDNIIVRDKYQREYICDTFLITPKWETQGDIASVEIEFQTATVAKKIGKGIMIGNNGDFNEDFNEDFNNQ